MRQRRTEAGDFETSSVETSEAPKKFSKPKSSSSSNHWNIFGFCLAFRVVNALLIQTYFNPDEHWQALEVAHRIAFGYGYLTWEWEKGIRSYLHPLLFVPLFKVLAFLGLDTPWFMIRSPRLLQSMFSAVGDLYLYKLSSALFGDLVAKWALFSQLANWFMFFCFNRTLSNSLETVLTLVALYYWPCMRISSEKISSCSRRWALAISALACAIRPTSAITWVYVGLLELHLAHDKLKYIFLEVIPTGTLVLGLTFLLDLFMYRTWIFVPLNFLKFNFLSSGGDYYGTHKWHWYFTQGFPVMLFTFIPFSLSGIMRSKCWKLSGLIAWVLGLYSLLGHKEFRFVLPVLPVALIFSGYSLATIEQPGFEAGKRRGSSTSSGRYLSRKQLAIFFLLVTNVPMALYMCLVHQRGTEDVMSYLSQEAVKGNVESVLFLMPCHATPYYSTLHHNLPMRFLDCSPREEKGILDESDSFMSDPLGFSINFTSNWSRPSHIIMFESEEDKLRDFLVALSFKKARRFFHAHFKVDRDLQASVLVYATSKR